MATSGTKEKSSCGQDKNKMLQGEKNTSIELIKEKMKEKRRKKALNDSNTSWSRSFSKRKGTTASFVLKASLRSNNKSLAKALATSKHDAQQAHRSILELQRDRQLLMQHANTTRLVEKECVKRFGNIKQVLTKVTTSLLDAVTSLSQALDLCSSLPLRDSSLGIIPRTSTTSDDDSFGIVQKADHGPSTYYRKAELVSSAIESAASEIIQAATMATATIDQSEPVPGASQSDGATGTDQSDRPQVGLHQSDELKDFGNEDIDLEFPSLDDVDFPLRFTEVSPQDGGSCGSRRQSCLLKPPVKHPRTAALLDPAAMQKALAGDEDYAYADDPGQHDQTASPQPQPQPQSEHFSNTDTHNVSPATKVKSHNEKGSVKGSVARSRRATYNVTPVKSDSAANRTFEVLDPQESLSLADWPEFGIKERYVFVHSPPCESSNYKTLDMELTGVTTNSLSASQDERNKSLANKSRCSHDDQVIRPWGNIQTDMPSKPSATKVDKTQTKTKPPSNVSKSKLPKPPKKEARNTGVGIGDSSKIGLTKKSKDIKKASKKSKKAILTSESARNDLAVFDLSAGESFSLPPPMLNRIKSKPTDSLPGSAKLPLKDLEDNDCFIDKHPHEHQICCENQEDPNLLIAHATQPESMHQEEKLDPIPQRKHSDLMQKDKQRDPMHQKEQPDPMHQKEKLHVDPMQKVEQLEPMYQDEQLVPMYQKEQPDPMQQKEKLDPLHQDVQRDPMHQKEQPDPMHQVETEKAGRMGKIKRKTKKARYVVTPGIDKAAALGRKNKLSIITAQCDGVADDIFDGTYLGDQPPRMGKEEPACSGRVVIDADNTAKVLESTKPKNHRSNKEKQKAKAAKPPRTKLVRDDHGTKLNLPEDSKPHSVSLKTPTTKTVNAFVTFDIPESAPRNHVCDKDPSSDILGDIDDNLCIKKSRPSRKGRGPPRESVCRGSSKSPSVIATPLSSNPKDSETRCSPPTSTAHTSSLKKHTRDKGSSHQSKRGQKRMADAVEEEEAQAKVEEEVGMEETRRRSRRGAPVSYKEPSLHCKLRRTQSPDRMKKTTNNKRGSKRTALGTVTNVL